MQHLRRLWSDQMGQDLAEYALITGLVALAVIVGAMLLGTNLNNWFSALATFVSGIAAP